MKHGMLGDRLRLDQAAQEELAAWSEARVQMWVPLVQQDRLMGILVLGSKIADEFFAKQDHHALGTLAHQAAVSLARAQLVDRLQGQIHEIQALTKQVIALQERNQKRLSQELHDDVAQDLAFVLRLLEEPVVTHSPKKIIGARDVIQHALDRLRDLMFELRPPNLGDDLEKALKEYVASFRRRRNLPVVLHTNGNGVSVPKEVRVALFRICQEGLNNAMRHAEAGQVEVTLDLQDRGVRLVVEDDGVGFEVPTYLGSLIDQQHLGLVGMRERAEGVGGSFRLESEPGRGTRISVDVPLGLS
jgi:signal transduction histidine kinase